MKPALMAMLVVVVIAPAAQAATHHKQYHSKSDLQQIKSDAQKKAFSNQGPPFDGIPYPPVGSSVFAGD
jgi:uncharacterized protein YxeA